MITLAECEARDRADALASMRGRFTLPAGVIYLDGNSLGPLPLATAKRLQTVIEREWGQGLIRSWNQHGWVGQPRRVGDKLARLIGATPGEIIVADSTSLNVFKLLAAMLHRKVVGERRMILSERGNFPTDLYMAEGLNQLLGGRFELKLVDDDPALHLNHQVAVALLTQVDYRSGRLLDMAAVNAKAKSTGTSVLWDLSHSAGAVSVALNADGAEFAVGCGYKYLNGGPGAPAYLYVRQDLLGEAQQPLSGWFGHAAPFEFTADYRPAHGIEQMLVGTPSVIATTALECGVDLMLENDMATLRQKSLALTDLFITLMEEQCAEFGFVLASPREYSQRGSQLSFHHPHAYPVMQALIERGIIGDFRKPDFLRFGFAPLYVRFADVFGAVSTLRNIMETESWKAEHFNRLNAVT